MNRINPTFNTFVKKKFGIKKEENNKNDPTFLAIKKMIGQELGKNANLETIQ